MPNRFEEGIMLVYVGSLMENMSTSDEYKLGVYYPVLGSFLMELETCNKMLELWRPFKQTQSSVKQALEFCFSQTTDKKKL